MLDRKNILILKFPYGTAFGGGEAHTVALAGGLKEKGFEVFLASSDDILRKEFSTRDIPAKRAWGGVEPVSVAGVAWFTLLSPLVFIRLTWLLLVKRIRNKTKVLYCLSLTEKLLLAWPARLMGYKVFWIEHLRIERWLKRNPYRWFYKFYSKWVTIIAVSNAVRAQLIELGVRQKNTVVIYNGVDLDNFKPQDDPGNNEIVIGTTARLCTEKGLDFLIKGFKIVIDKGIDARLAIVGKGPELTNLREIVEKLGLSDKVEFKGFIDNIPGFLAGIDIFALTPVRRESFGIAVAEAEAMGKPAVVTDLSGLREVVKNGETGFVVEKQNPKAIAGKLILLATDQGIRTRMGEAARRRVEDNFGLDRMIDEFENLFVGNSNEVSGIKN